MNTAWRRLVILAIGVLLCNDADAQHIDVHVCPLDGTPVCVSDGINVQLFPNECLLQTMNGDSYPHHTNLRKVAIGFCTRNCPLVCPATYQPLCALDLVTPRQRTFGNACEMARDSCLTGIAWEQQSDGICGGPSTAVSKANYKVKRHQQTSGHRRKAIPCPKVFNPVCAILSGVKSTFVNECLVNAENIKTGKDWKITSKGVCAEDYVDRTKNSARNGSTTSKRNPKLQAYDEIANDPTIIYPTAELEREFGNDIFAATEQTELEPGPGDALVTFTDDYNDLAEQTAEGVDEAKPTEQPRWIHFPDEDDATVAVCKYGGNALCGTFERKIHTFGNICELMLRNIFLDQNWSILHEGDCRNCSHECGEEYAPVCVARNAINYTLANTCYLNSAICKDKTSAWRVISSGECLNETLPQTDVYKIPQLNTEYGVKEVRTTTLPSPLSTAHSTTVRPLPKLSTTTRRTRVYRPEKKKGRNSAAGAKVIAASLKANSRGSLRSTTPANKAPDGENPAKQRASDNYEDSNTHIMNLIRPRGYSMESLRKAYRYAFALAL